MVHASRLIAVPSVLACALALGACAHNGNLMMPDGQPPAKVGDMSSNSIGMELVYAPAGQFQMGSPQTEPRRAADETLHDVTLSKPFLIGAAPVTQSQWRKVMGENPSRFHGSALPVENVSWDQAVEFCAKLSAMEPGRTYRLPTEAEWEYACRAGTTTAFNTGDTINTDDANFDASDEALGGVKGEYRHTTTAVKQLKPNAWGLYDTHGNVFQWCADFYGAYPKKAVTDPTGPQAGEYRVARGGSWDHLAPLCRSASRHKFTPATAEGYLGFRVVVDVPPAPPAPPAEPAPMAEPAPVTPTTPEAHP